MIDKRWGYKWYNIRNEKDYVLHCRILGYTHKEIACRLRRKKEKILELDSLKIHSYNTSII